MDGKGCREGWTFPGLQIPHKSFMIASQPLRDIMLCKEGHPFQRAPFREGSDTIKSTAAPER